MPSHDAFLHAMESTIPPLADAIQAAVPLLGFKKGYQQPYPGTMMLSMTPKGTKAMVRLEKNAQRSAKEQERLDAILPKLTTLFFGFARSFALLPTFAHPFYWPQLRHVCATRLMPQGEEIWRAHLCIARHSFFTTSHNMGEHLAKFAAHLHHLPSSAGTPMWRINSHAFHAQDPTHALAIRRVLSRRTTKTLPVVYKVLDARTAHQEALALLNAT